MSNQKDNETETIKEITRKADALIEEIMAVLQKHEVIGGASAFIFKDNSCATLAKTSRLDKTGIATLSFVVGEINKAIDKQAYEILSASDPDLQQPTDKKKMH